MPPATSDTTTDTFISKYTKIVISGTQIEQYDYEKAPNTSRKIKQPCFKCHAFGKPAGYRCQSCTAKLLTKRRRAKRNVQRAKDNFRRLVRSALGLGSPYFVTLTMVSVESMAVSYREFSRFTTNLRKLYGRGVAWVAVPEFQKRGAIHFHVLLWGLNDEVYQRERDTRDLQFLWGRGWLDVLKSDGHPKIASYMAKYMSKGMYDSRAGYSKAYTASRNILRPVPLNTGTQIEVVKEEYPEIDAVDNGTLQSDFERYYKTEWLGRCRYRVINVK